jgi:iron complex transport system substrate-binding protein
MKHFLAALCLCASLTLAVACGDSDSPSQPGPGAARVDLTKDDLGRAVSAPVPARRIVAMSPSVVELMFAVGATPIGRPSSADFPPAAATVPHFGTSYQPNFEEIAAMRPDLIIADAIIHQPMVDDLAKLGAPVFAVRISSFDDVVRGLRVVGALTGNAEAGEREAKALEAKLAGITAKIPTSGPSVLVLVAAGQGQFIAARDNSYLVDLVKRLGGRNLVSSDPESFRFAGFTELSQERIIERNPDLIITASIGGPPGTPKTSDLLKASPAFSSLKAVREGRVYEVDATVYIQSAGPRVSQVLDELPRVLYPNVFASGR